VLRVSITLEDVVPTVWRRLLVPGAVRLAKLHRIFQAGMGWTDSHLHAFTMGDQRYGMHFDDYPEDEIDENEVSVMKAVGDHRRFVYERIGGSFDPASFDLASTNVSLQHLR
jgi:hypothetical protein